MKRLIGLLVLALVLVFVAGVCSAEKVTDWEREGLRGKVRTIEKKIEYIREFRTNIYRTKVEYHPTGFKRYYYLGAGNEVPQLRQVYDEQGRILRRIDAEEQEYRYESNRVFLTIDGVQSGVGQIDQNGNIIEIISDVQGQEILKGSQEYDERGRMTKFVTNLNIIETEYDFSGRILKQKTRWTNYIRDNKGKIISPTEDSESLFYYDQKGNLKMVENVSLTSLLFKINYQYQAFDDQGNWLEREQYDEKNVLFTREYRKITYFE